MVDPHAEGTDAVMAVVHVEISSFVWGGTGCHLKDVVYLKCSIGRAYTDIWVGKSWRKTQKDVEIATVTITRRKWFLFKKGKRVAPP